MPRHQTRAQRETVERVMHEFKHGELKTARGARKVKNPKQAIAIGLREAGASTYESPKKNRENLAKTKTRERKGETGRDVDEGRKARSTARAKATRSTARSETARGTTRSTARSTARKPASRGGNGRSGGVTKAELVAKARKRNIPGRSKMSKGELQRALAR
jgi:hypothetical protein